MPGTKQTNPLNLLLYPSPSDISHPFFTRFFFSLSLPFNFNPSLRASRTFSKNLSSSASLLYAIDDQYSIDDVKLLEAALHFHSFKCTSVFIAYKIIIIYSSTQYTSKSETLFEIALNNKGRKNEILNRRPRGHARLLCPRLGSWYFHHQELLRYRHSLCPRRQLLRNSHNHTCRQQF